MLLFAGLLIISPRLVFARENVNYWYIKDFISEITVNSDSSLTIIEGITADCGACVDKHGIFRILPTVWNTTEGKIQTPVELLSITDFSGKPYKYQTLMNYFDGTITWKIGDPRVTVRGENYYKISYRVKNAIRPRADFDELYWDLTGNFWDLDIDNFTADIILPQGVNSQNTAIEYYTGYLGEKNRDLASYAWAGERTLRFSSLQTIRVGEGITVSAVFPGGIVQPYVPGIFDDPRWSLLWFLLPIAIFIFSFLLWRKYGDDPNLHRATMPEYEPPDNLGPLEVGAIWKGGGVNVNFITAAIIKMACDKLFTIREIKEKKFLFTVQDFEFQRTSDNVQEVPRLSPPERLIFDALFAKSEFSKDLEFSRARLSEIKKDFHHEVHGIGKAVQNELINNGYLEKSGFTARGWMFAFMVLFLIISFFFMKFFTPSVPLIFSLIFSLVTLAIFSGIMPKRTLKGAEAAWRIKGLKMYMDSAEKDRQRFYETEGIFDKLLPYAIVFGMTKQWAKKVREIYGDEYMRTHAPAWYIASASGGGFNVDNFASELDHLSSAISQSVSPSSGAGGAGGAGGGGGGGGGGGW